MTENDIWDDTYDLAALLKFPDGIGDKEEDNLYWLDADTQKIYVTFRGRKFIVSVEPEEKE